MTKWQKFLFDVQNHIKALDLIGCDIPFFRGHSNGSWELLCGLGRSSKAKKYRYIESTLYHDFLALAGPLLDDANSPWDTLFAMQHHGLPTRLLDWSHTFSVALYFALKPYLNVKSRPSIPTAELPCIWMLNPFALNKASMNDDSIFNPHTDLEVNYWDVYINEKKKFPTDVVALNPTQTSRRLAVQRSGFTFHNEIDAPLEQKYSDLVRKFVIPAAAIPEALSFLTLAGVNEYSLYPDLDGLARYLMIRHM
ncbi:FRG domain-containing protein [Ferrovibrio terrae]|uniref:FRG domain-containing protein n=1 Tax=Ferrovibrio terrae TaxID=2594003 RepID=UPI003137FD01